MDSKKTFIRATHKVQTRALQCGHVRYPARVKQPGRKGAASLLAVTTGRPQFLKATTALRVGKPGGVAELDDQGHVPVEQLPQSGLTFKGEWDALTNTPFLVSGVGERGDQYIVSVAGTSVLDGIDSWQVGDIVVFNGLAWQQLQTLAPELSLFPQVDAVTLQLTPGNSATVDKAGGGLAGVLDGARADKIDSVETGAEVNPTPGQPGGFAGLDSAGLLEPTQTRDVDLHIVTQTAAAIQLRATGTSATLPSATAALAGLMSASDKAKLDQPPSGTDLSHTTTPTTVTVASSTGSSTTIATASSSQAGVLSSALFDDVANIATTIDTAIAAQKAQPNGLASLNSSGLVPVAQLPVSALTYKGTWDANTNTPDLVDATPAIGDFYLVTVAGTTNLNGITDWQVGDFAVFGPTGFEQARVGLVPTNLAVASLTATTLDVTSSTGGPATLPEATPVVAGLLGAADKSKLDSVSASAEPNAPTDLTVSGRTVDTVTVGSSTGTSAVLPAADTSLAGVMTKAQVQALEDATDRLTQVPILVGGEIPQAYLPPVNLGQTPTATTVEVTNSSGTPAVLGAATAAIAGVLSAVDKQKLDAAAPQSALDAEIDRATDAEHDLQSQVDALQAQLNGFSSGRVLTFGGKTEGKNGRVLAYNGSSAGPTTTGLNDSSTMFVAPSDMTLTSISWGFDKSATASIEVGLRNASAFPTLALTGPTGFASILYALSAGDVVYVRTTGTSSINKMTVTLT